MNKPIGKLLWHKAVRKTATYTAAPGNNGLVVIEIPVEFDNPYWYTFPNGDDGVTSRISTTIHKHLVHTGLFPIPNGYKVLTRIKFNKFAGPDIVVICEMQTQRLQDWQWISTAHRFKGGEMPAGLDIKYDFNP